MKILLTGSTGQLGQALLEAKSSHRFVPLNRSELDISREADVRETLQRLHPDMVINCAAFTRVDLAETSPKDAFAINARGPEYLARWTARQNLPLLHISTDYVFDGLSGRPYHELDQPRPLSVYGQSKLAGEQLIRKLNPRHYIVRTAWLFNVTGFNFLKTMIIQGSQNQVRVVNDQFGCPTFAPHLAQGLLNLIDTRPYGTYHMAGGGWTCWYDLTVFLYRALGFSTPVMPVSTAEFPRPAHRPPYGVLTTIKNAPALPLWEDGVREFVNSIRNH